VNDAASGPHPTIWAFWVACGVAVAAGLAPILLAGTSGREDGVLLPMLVAAAAYAGCVLLESQGKLLVTGLYFLAGLATLYGVLAMLAVPLRLAVIGTCQPGPAPCAAGLEQPLSAAENAGIGFAAALGVIALFVGFFGLVVLYRRLNAGMPAAPRARRILPFVPSRTPEPATSPPVRRIPPVVHKPSPEPEAATAAPAAEPPPAAEPELTAPPSAPELAAPEPQLELPAHAGTPPPAEEAIQPAPAPRPRRKRAPRKDSSTPDASAT
jgi:hypothetical protein